ncbi:hypothetical protein A2693_04285 [Candidatus Curtissbacteria bacterium RIFCSPHIGHO2_01_FULL_40_12]|uniref:Uncharacterized protein n=1 Tax=Candidatus Curtissbacteria bacterium RIFCSPHIGHO2_01_FULL_40_12 TaxID=1797710 RepID=A0A1F5G9F6_9BACT|nr:MAG: hypothetical protein A2693_04285 [Candidatus Curtissbacteria bacterium RIFCSPHIGHO2_01_FULL_40_12]
MKVLGYTQHGLQQKITRQVSSELIKETVSKPLVVLKQAGDTFLHLTDKAAVVLNKAGQVVTTYGSDLFKDTVKNVLNSVK